MNLKALAPLGEELKRNPRLRLGLVVIVALIAIYQITGISQWRASIAADYSLQQERLLRIRGISKQDGWAQRAADAASMRKALQAEISDANSVGLAQATFQGWLSGLVRSTGKPLQITMGAPVKLPGQSGYWKIPAQVAGNLSIREAMELIRQVESRKELVTVDSIELTNDQYPRASLALATYYHVAQ
ncbi:MAG: hypothetical protein OJF55_001921 [Rhodanobacteraceae bacterium]|jgi:hypothetical protein|nr:MAG: hypothetical protein OJF55_001921 [Rhodanobacteraceae bacterium]